VLARTWDAVYNIVMLKLSSSLHNLSVVSLRSSATVAVAYDPIINPHNLKIIGWWCKSPMSPNPLVLLTYDIREGSDHGLTIDDEDDLSDPEDLARHKEILELNFDLIGKTVKTKRQKIGKVEDFSYNEGLIVQKLYVEKPLTKVFNAEDTAIIDRTQILEVNDDYILVKDTDVKSKESEFARAAIPAS
jgi:sporulation protein YlmC with PRC-barrel domain